LYSWSRCKLLPLPTGLLFADFPAVGRNLGRAGHVAALGASMPVPTIRLRIDPQKHTALHFYRVLAYFCHLPLLDDSCH